MLIRLARVAACLPALTPRNMRKYVVRECVRNKVHGHLDKQIVLRNQPISYRCPRRQIRSHLPPRTQQCTEDQHYNRTLAHHLPHHKIKQADLFPWHCAPPPNCPIHTIRKTCQLIPLPRVPSSTTSNRSRYSPHRAPCGNSRSKHLSRQPPTITHTSCSNSRISPLLACQIHTSTSK